MTVAAVPHVAHRRHLQRGNIGMKVQRLGICTLLLVALLAMCGVVSPAQGAPRLGAAVKAPPPGTYLFVELWVEVAGTGTLPGYVLDFPGYRFNPPAGTLQPFFRPLPPLHPSQWGFAGRGDSRSGAAGSGISSNLLIIPTLPFSTTLPIGTGTAGPTYEHTRPIVIELLSIDDEGELVARIDGARESLIPGERWQHQVAADLKNASYDGRYVVTSTVTNYGWQVRSLAKLPTQFVWVPLARR